MLGHGDNNKDEDDGGVEEDSFQLENTTLGGIKGIYRALLLAAVDRVFVDPEGTPRSEGRRVDFGGGWYEPEVGHVRGRRGCIESLSIRN